MARGVRISFEISPTTISGIQVEGARTAEGIVSRIIQDRLQEAVLRIRRYWPIDTGRSWQAWNVRRLSALTFVVENQASSDYGEYAGYVHRRGETRPLIETLIPDDIQQAAREIRVDILELRRTGKSVAGRPPSLTQMTVDRLRAAIAQKLLERIQSRARRAA